MINYTLPDFTVGLGLNLFFIRLLEQRPALFQDGVRIDSVYGCFPACDLNGGRAFLRERATPRQMEEAFSLLAEHGVKARLTLTNMLADGHILVQRFGDILDGKRTWPKELAFSNVRPTLPDAVAGDITAGMPYRAMINIIGFIQAMDQVVPGFASYETLLYSPELKFYSNRVKMDTDFNTSLQGLHCLGDSSGWTRGLMMASIMGVLMGRKISEEG